MSDVKNFTKPKVVDFPKEDELHNRMLDLINEYVAELSLVAVVGILEVVKEHTLKACDE